MSNALDNSARVERYDVNKVGEQWEWVVRLVLYSVETLTRVEAVQSFIHIARGYTSIFARFL